MKKLFNLILMILAIATVTSSIGGCKKDTTVRPSSIKIKTVAAVADSSSSLEGVSPNPVHH